MAEELGLGVVPWGPLGQGVLTGKYNGFTPEGAQEALKRVSASADRAEQAEAIDVDTRRAKVALGELDPKNSQVAREVASIAVSTSACIGDACARVDTRVALCGAQV